MAGGLTPPAAAGNEELDQGTPILGHRGQQAGEVLWHQRHDLLARCLG